jgi:hypothetical protein
MLKYLVLFLLLNTAFAKEEKKKNDSNDPFRVGFFLGGRTGTFFRYWQSKTNEKKFPIALVTKNIRENKFFVIKKFNVKAVDKKWSKASGDELINLMLEGKADSALIGETSFVKMVQNKLPIVAIAETGHDVSGEAGHAMIFRENIDLNNPQSWKGLTFGARRSSGGDLIILKEFLLSVGLDPNKDVKIIDQIDDDKFAKYLKKRKIDAGYFHLASARGIVAADPKKFRIYKSLDWVKPEISSALLVVNKDYLIKNKNNLKRMLQEYSKFIINEKKMSKVVRNTKSVRGIQMEENFMGMNFPQSYDCPYVRSELLVEWQKILVKHQVVKNENNLSAYIDNSLFDCNK